MPTKTFQKTRDIRAFKIVSLEFTRNKDLLPSGEETLQTSSDISPLKLLTLPSRTPIRSISIHTTQKPNQECSS